MEEGGEQKGLEGTGLKVESNRHGNLTSATSDASFTDILQTVIASKKTAVINYGASWYRTPDRCLVCSQILPVFCQMSNKFPKMSFVYADIDECPDTTQNIRYTPTFQFYRNGERVDEMYGAGEDRLHDRLWLHS